MSSSYTLPRAGLSSQQVNFIAKIPLGAYGHTIDPPAFDETSLPMSLAVESVEEGSPSSGTNGIVVPHPVRGRSESSPLRMESMRIGGEEEEEETGTAEEEQEEFVTVVIG